MDNGWKSLKLPNHRQNHRQRRYLLVNNSLKSAFSYDCQRCLTKPGQLKQKIKAISLVFFYFFVVLWEILTVVVTVRVPIILVIFIVAIL